METTCKNCGHVFEHNYCNKCGQSAKVKRLQIREIVNDFNYNVLRVNKGLLYTIKELVIRPGDMLHDYIDGKRVRHINPINFLLISGVFLGFLYFFSPVVLPKLEISSEFVYLKEIIIWIYQNSSITILLIIPFLAFGVKWGLWKEKLNYSEAFVMLCYVLGILSFSNILTFYNKNNTIETIVNIIVLSWLFFALMQFLKRHTIGKRILMIVTTFVLEFVMFLICVVFAGIVYFLLFFDTIAGKM